MSEPFIAEIMMFAGNFAPRGWAFCSGQLLPIAQNQALFALIGTIYGGNGTTTFALPDLRGRMPMHPGQGPGLSSHSLGEVAGSENVTLTTSQIPSHAHSVAPGAASGEGQTAQPTGNVPAAGEEPTKPYAPTGNTSLAPTTTSAVGGSQPHQNMPPYLCVNFVIALVGIFPPRD